MYMKKPSGRVLPNAFPLITKRDRMFWSMDTFWTSVVLCTCFTCQNGSTIRRRLTRINSPKLQHKTDCKNFASFSSINVLQCHRMSGAWNERHLKVSTMAVKVSLSLETLLTLSNIEDPSCDILCNIQTNTATTLWMQMNGISD